MAISRNIYLGLYYIVSCYRLGLYKFSDWFFCSRNILDIQKSCYRKIMITRQEGECKLKIKKYWKMNWKDIRNIKKKLNIKSYRLYGKCSFKNLIFQLFVRPVQTEFEGVFVCNVNMCQRNAHINLIPGIHLFV